MAEKPEGWREVTLGEILTDPQLAAMMKTIEDLERRGIKPVDPAYAEALKELFAPWKEELEQKGVVADYLAYVITRLAFQGKLK